MHHQRYLIQWKDPTLGKIEGYIYLQARMAEAEEEVVAVNGVRRQLGVQVEQEQSGSLRKGCREAEVGLWGPEEKTNMSGGKV